MSPAESVLVGQCTESKSRPSRYLWLLLVLPAVSIPVTALLGSAPYDSISRDYPGATTALLSITLHVVTAVASTLCVGNLFFVTFLRGRSGPDRDIVDPVIDLRPVQVSAGIWFAASLLLVLVDAADANGYPLGAIVAKGVWAG